MPLYFPAARRLLKTVLCLILINGVIPAAYAAAYEPIRWRSTEPQTSNYKGGKLEVDQARHFIVQFSESPDRSHTAQLAADNIRLLRYLGSHSYFASGKLPLPGQASAAPIEFRTALIEPWQKLHPSLVTGDLPSYARFDSPGGAADGGLAPAASQPVRMLALYVVFHPDVDLISEGASSVYRHSGEVRSLMVSINAAVVWIPEARLSALASEDSVEWIEPPLPPLSENNDSVRAATQTDIIQADSFNLDGSGINVLVYDGGTARAVHPDFGGRLTIRDNSGANEHATHVSATIAGSGYRSYAAGAQAFKWRGMAPAAVVQSYGFQYDGTGTFLYTNPGDLETDYFEAVNNYGAVIANNSIGTNVAPNGFPCALEGDYGVTDMLIDSIVCGSLGSPMRIVWAGGNERSSGRCGTTYRTIAPPAGAKNHISVGAINSNNLSMTTFSGWGPTDDGRLKPDICAPGCQSDGDLGVMSATDNDLYGAKCGTSMACPTVTGISALILQDWKALLPGLPLPTNAMLKTLLVHNAQDLGAGGPDYQFGYGGVQALETINFLRSMNWTTGTVQQAGISSYHVLVEPGTPFLKCTVAWDDPPGAANTAPQLVNNLDVTAEGPTGAIKYPWTLDPAVPSAAAVANQPDSLNNLEQVYVSSPSPGLWTIHVTGTSVADGPQDFSLACSPNMTPVEQKLVVLPRRDVEFSGPIGGPFTPDCADYRVLNASAGPVDWETSVSVPWLLTTPTNGLLQPGTSTTVQLCLAPDTASLCPTAGRYSAEVGFVDLLTSETVYRDVHLNVYESADLSLSVTDSPDPVLQTQNISYSVTIHNSGPDDASSVVLRDAIPMTSTYVSASITSGSCSVDAGQIVCSLASLPAGSSTSAAIVLNTRAFTLETNTISVSAAQHDPELSSNEVIVSTTCIPARDVRVLGKSSVSPATVGAPMDYTFTVINEGPAGSSGVQLNNVTTDNVMITSASVTRGTLQLTDNQVSWNVGPLAGADPGSISWVSRGTIPGIAAYLVADHETGKIYSIDNYRKLFVYSPTTQTWTTLPALPGSGFLQVGCATICRGKLYVFYGLLQTTFYAFDLQQQTWSLLDKHVGLSFETVTTDGSALYLFFGLTAVKFDVTTGLWSNLSGPPASLESRAVAAYLDGFVYVTQGMYGPGFYRYQIKTNSWVTLPSSPLRTARVSTLDPLGRKFYTVARDSNVIYRYSIDSAKWDTVGFPGTWSSSTMCYSARPVNRLYVSNSNALSSADLGYEAVLSLQGLPVEAGDSTSTAEIIVADGDFDPGNNTAVVTAKVRQPIDLHIVPRVPEQTTQGATLVALFDVGNGGPGAATGVQLKLQGSEQFDYVGAIVPATSTAPWGKEVSLTLPDLDPFTTQTVSCSIVPAVSGSLIIGAELMSAEWDHTVSDNDTTATTTVAPVQNLVLSASASQTTVALNGSVEFYADIKNSGLCSTSGTLSVATDQTLEFTSASISSGTNWVTDHNIGLYPGRIFTNTLHYMDWTPLALSPGSLTCAAYDSSSGILYAIQEYWYVGLLYRYDSGNNSWSSLSMPFGNGSVGGGEVIKGKYYLMLTQTINDMRIYDIASNSWSATPSPFGSGTAALATDGDRLYAVHGTSFRRYTPSPGTWEILPSPPVSFSVYSSAAFLDGAVYVNGASNQFYRYDISSGIWTKRANPPGISPIQDMTADTVNRRIYLSSSTASEALKRYNPDNNTWETTTNPLFPSITHGPLVFADGARPRLYVGRGQYYNSFGAVELPAVTTATVTAKAIAVGTAFTTSVLTGENSDTVPADNTATFGVRIMRVPTKAIDPSPGVGNVVPMRTILRWTGDEASEIFRVHLGTSNPPDFLETTSNPLCDPGMLNPNSHYYWRIDSQNVDGTAEGDVWSFDTTNEIPVKMSGWNVE